MKITSIAPVATAILCFGHSLASPIAKPETPEVEGSDAADSNMNSFSDDDASHLRSLGRMPPNAPADFWHNTARPKPGGGRHFELMYCNRAYNRKAEMSEGQCTYTVGMVENGDATIYTPGSKGIIAPCDQPMKFCYRDMMKNHVGCHVSPKGAKVVPNGLCAYLDFDAVDAVVISA